MAVIPAPRCSSSNCATGCCQFTSGDDTGTCVTTQSASACAPSGQVCSACLDGKGCNKGLCEYIDEPFPPGSKAIFMTSGAYSGNLGGLSGADEKCQAAATSAGRTGTYKAWLSNFDSDLTTGTVLVNISAYSRITGDGPWYLTCRDVRKKVIKAFANRSSLQGSPLDFINCDENGMVRSAGGEVYVWTGTETGGGPEKKPRTTANCSGWTSTGGGFTGLAGENSSMLSHWTQFLEHECAQTGRLYCLEQ